MAAHTMQMAMTGRVTDLSCRSVSSSQKARTGAPAAHAADRQGKLALGKSSFAGKGVSAQVPVSVPRARNVVTLAVSEPEASTTTESETKKFWFCIANADFMLNDENNEHFPEILRERRRFYRETNKEQDFWLVPNPAFLDAMPDVAKKIRQPCVAIVTNDEIWNTFIKLRLDRVYKGALEGTKEEVLKSKAPVPKDAFPAVDPSKWTAPYAKYSPGWWIAFEPGNEDA